MCVNVVHLFSIIANLILTIIIYFHLKLRNVLNYQSLYYESLVWENVYNIYLEKRYTNNSSV